MKKLVLAVPLILIFGCKKPGELYCQTHADCAKWGLDFCDINGEYPASDGIAPTCIDNPFDAGPDVDASPGDAATNDADTSCAEHSQCASKVCDPAAKVCADVSQIVYVDDQSGADDVDCGAADSPCKTISFGVLQIGEGRRFLHVQPGTYVDDNVSIEGRRVHIVANGVELYGVGDGTSLSVLDAANVVVEGLVMSGVQVRCTAHSALELQEVTVSDIEQRMGVYIGGCTALIEDSIIRDVTHIGLDAIDGTVRRTTFTGNQLAFSVYGDVTIEQSIILDNYDGGGEYYPREDMTTGFVFRNNLVAENGGSSANFIALSLYGAAVVEHNTIIGNTAKADAPTVSCGGDTTMMGNIIYRNVGGDSVRVRTGCSITYSNVEGGVPGIGNIDVNPDFVPGDYHLEESSPCIDRVPSEVTVDIDGEARPGGGMNDMGADEVL